MLIWAEEQLCEWVWYWLELKRLLRFHPVVDSVFLLCGPRGAPVCPQTQYFLSDRSLGFSLGGGDPSSNWGYNTSICQNGQDPHGPSLGGWEHSRPSLTLATSPRVTANWLGKLSKKISSQLCPVLIKWEIKLNKGWQMVSLQCETIPRK